MIIVEIAIASIISIIVPFLVGDLLLPNEAVGKQYIMGILGTLAVSQLVFIPFILYQHHFTPYYLVFVLLIGACCISSIVKRYKSYKDRIKCIASFDFKKEINIWMICSVALIGYQVIRAALAHFFVYADDAHYIPVINDLLYTDLDYYFNYTKGEPGCIETDVKYLFTTYFPYLASISKISGLHPAILVQTVLPVILTIALYVLVWHYGKTLFKDNKNAWIFVFFFALLVETMCGYLLTHANHVIVSIYYGKKIVFTLLIPFIMLFLAEKTSMLEDEVKLLSKKDVFCLAVMMLGVCAPSLMGAGLAPILIFCMGMVLSVRKKTIIPLLQMVIGMMPTIVILLMVVYNMFMRK